MKINLQQIAESLNISISTVSRVINNKPGIKQETRDKINSYIKNHNATITNSEFKSIGVVDTYLRHSISGYYLAFLLEGIDKRLNSLGYNMTLIHFDQIQEQYHRLGYSPVLQAQKGLIWLEPLFNRDHLQIINDHEIECVVINNSLKDIPVNYVKSNNYDAAVNAIDLLARKGHQKIGFVGGYLKLTNHADRWQGFSDGLMKNKLELNMNWVSNNISSWDKKGGFEGAFHILNQQERPTAIMLMTDLLAEGAYNAAKELEYDIPEDISFISFDDSPLANLLQPSLSSFQQPLLEMSTQAVDLLLEQLIKPQKKETIQKNSVNCPLVLRNSICPVSSIKS